MVRKIIKIDAEKCNGCGMCCDACHEGAIGLVDGKARLLKDEHCDGLGDCLPVCPTGAITFEEREAAAYDAAAVAAKKARAEPLACGCPGTHAHALRREAAPAAETPAAEAQSHLAQWPVQLKLVPPGAPYLAGAHLLVAADCTAFAHGDFHRRFMKNRVTLIGCPKLDDEDYSARLTAILRQNDIKSVTVVRMEVPCCGGIQQAVVSALRESGKLIPWQVVTLSTAGEVLEAN